jgi:AsmA protein
MRKLLIALGIVLALAVVAVLALPFVVDVNRYRPQIESRLKDALGRTVSLGKMDLSLRPFGFRVENAIIGEDPSFATGRPFAQVRELYVSPELVPLFSGDVRISSALLRQPQIELVRNRQGTWNFVSLAAQQKEKQAPQPERRFTLDELRIEGGQVAVTDLQQSKERAVYDHIDITLRDYAPDQPFFLRAAAHLPGEGAQMLSIEGTAGPLAQDGAANTPFDGQVTFDQVSLSGLRRFVKTAALEGTEAVITGETQLRNRQGEFSSSGELRMENVRVRKVDIGYPIAADYNVSGNLHQETVRIEKGDLRLGQTPLNFTGTINAAPTPMLLDVKLEAGNVAIGEVARLASAFGVAFNPNTKVDGRLDADLTARGSAAQPALNGQLRARDIRITGAELKQPVEVPAVELTLTPEIIRSNRFTATTAGSSVAVEGAVHDYTGKSPRFQATVNTGKAELGGVLNIARAYGVSAVEGMSGSGTLTLDVTASGPVKQPERATFSGSGELSSATLHLPSLTKPLEIRSTSLKFSSDAMAMENVVLAAGKTTARGRLTLRNFAAPQVQFSLAADTIDAGEWQQIVRKDGATPARQPSATPTAARGEPSILERTTGSGTLSVETLIFNEAKLSNLRSDVRLDKGVIRLAPLTAELFGGKQVGEIVVDLRPTPATYAVNTRFEQVDANKLLSSVSSIKETLYGLLAANANARFTSADAAPEIARSLNGKAALNLRDGKLARVDLLRQLADIGKFSGFSRAAEPFTKLLQLTGNFDIKDGVAATNDLRAQIEGGTLAANGTVNLVNESLNMRVTAVLSQALSQQVGGTNVGGFMTTALANNKGELVLPIIVSGTFQKPQFAPDVQKIAEMKLQNLLPTGSDPGKLTTGILGGILGGKQEGEGQQRPVRGILDALGGRQPQQQQQQQQPQQEAQPGAEQPPQSDQAQPDTRTPEQKQKDAIQEAVESLFGKKKEEKKQSQPQPQQPPPQ